MISKWHLMLLTSFNILLKWFLVHIFPIQLPLLPFKWLTTHKLKVVQISFFLPSNSQCYILLMSQLTGSWEPNSDQWAMQTDAINIFKRFNFLYFEFVFIKLFKISYQFEIHLVLHSFSFEGSKVILRDTHFHLNDSTVTSIENN